MRAFQIRLALFFVPSLSLAQETLQVDLPSGTISIRMESFQAIITGASKEIRLDSAYMPDVVSKWRDSVLLFTATGGSACPGNYTWITIKKNDLRATDTFGTCSDLGQVEVTEAGPKVKMPRLTDGGITAYLFSDGAIIEKELGLTSANISDPLDATSWIGLAAFAALSSPELEPELLKIMDWDTLQQSRSAATISSDTMSSDAGWISAIGCEPHNCNGAAAGIAISKNDGRLIIGIWTKENGGKLYGQPDSALPDKLRSLLARGY